VRSADCYMFCLYPETDPTQVDVLDADTWQSYVLSTEQAKRELGEQRTVGTKNVQALWGPAGYDDLKAPIDSVLRIRKARETQIELPRLLQPESVEIVPLPHAGTVGVPKAMPTFKRWAGEPIADSLEQSPFSIMTMNLCSRN
jgi:hypothetical protein